MDIASAAEPTYTLTSSDYSRWIRLRVTATNTAGSNSSFSAPRGPVAAMPTANTGAPVVTGTAKQGRQLTTSDGTWQGTARLSYSYEWQRCSGSTCTTVGSGSSYTLVAADVGARMKALVTASGPGGQESAASALTAVVAPSTSTGGGSTGGGSPGGGSPGGGSGTVSLKRLSPFPVVAIGGRVIGRRVLVSLLKISRAPRGSIVTITCKGRGCPFRRMRRKITRKAGLRVHSLERSLRSGTVITIVVRKGNLIGKYTRLRIRGGSPPARVDRCIKPGTTRATACG